MEKWKITEPQLFYQVRYNGLPIYQANPGYLPYMHYGSSWNKPAAAEILQADHCYDKAENLEPEYNQGFDLFIRHLLAFKVADVLRFEKDQEREKAKLKPPTPLTRETKPQRPSSKHKERCQGVAARLWKRNPELTIEEMCFRDEITLIFKDRKQGMYSTKTIRNWIKHLCPNRSPGRRKTK